ncbi:MAG: Holliday junction resolvase RuvX [Rhodothermales bacterium]
MVPKPRTAAVDYGTKRVGLATADPLHLFAQPYGTFSPDQAVETLRAMRVREGLDVLVVGWPLTLAGEEGKMTERVQEFINRLRRALPDVQVVKWEERFTPERAKEASQVAGTSRHARRDKGRIDAAAAAILLQDYLDR